MKPTEEKLERYLPQFDELRRQMQPEKPNYKSRLLRQYPDLMKEGALSVIWFGYSYCSAAVGRYLVEQVALGDVNQEKNAVVVFSFSKSAESYWRVMALSRSGANFWRLERNLVPKSELARISQRYTKERETLAEMDLEVVEAAGMTMDEMEKEARELMSGSDRIGLILIDSLLDCRVPGTGANEIGWTMVGLRLNRLARELHVPVVVLASGMPRGDRGEYNSFTGALRNYANSNYHVDWGEPVNRDGWNVRSVPFVKEDEDDYSQTKFCMYLNLATRRLCDQFPWEED